jgi:uncharacterized protein (DUF2147 family)
MLSASSQPGEIFGVWVTDDGRGAVRIAACGTSVCGRVTWLRDMKRRDGGPMVDVNNPDRAKQSRPICGLQVIGGLRRQADRTWDEGWIYDPKVGKTYKVALSLKDAGTLTVYGYVTKMLGRSHYWTRAPRNLANCS